MDIVSSHSAQVGIIPVLASLLGSAVREMAADVQSNCIPGGRERLTELQVEQGCHRVVEGIL